MVQQEIGNGTSPGAAASPAFYDSLSTVLLLVLASFSCLPVWILVLRSECFYPPARKRSPLDVCLVWSQRAITFMAGFYFIQAIMLFPPEYFVSSTFSAASFIVRDMTALKHIMHACFFFCRVQVFLRGGQCTPA